MSKRGVTTMEAATIVLLLVAIIVSGGTLAYLAGPIQEAIKGPGVKPTVKMGLTTALSPPGYYEGGKMILRGAEIGVDLVNRAGGVLDGRELELIVEDTSGIVEKGVAATRKLIEVDNVVCTSGCCHSSVMLKMQDINEEYHVPTLTTYCSNPEITERGLQYTFRCHNFDSDVAAMWVDFIEEEGFEKVIHVYEDTDFGVMEHEMTSKEIEDRGLDVEYEGIMFDRTMKDFVPILLQIRESEPDLFIVTGAAPATLIITEQAYDIGLHPDVPLQLSNDDPVYPFWWEGLGEKGNYVLFMGFSHPNMERSSMGEAIRAEYWKRYSEEPPYIIYNEAANIHIFAQAIEMAGSDDPEAICEALRTGEFDTFIPERVTFPEMTPPTANWHHYSYPFLVCQCTEVEQAYSDTTIILPEEYKTGDYTPPPE